MTVQMHSVQIYFTLVCIDSFTRSGCKPVEVNVNVLILMFVLPMHVIYDLQLILSTVVLCMRISKS